MSLSILEMSNASKLSVKNVIIPVNKNVQSGARTLSNHE